MIWRILHDTTINIHQYTVFKAVQLLELEINTQVIMTGVQTVSNFMDKCPQATFPGVTRNG